MSAAAMFSLCAKADDPTLLGSMDFETGYSAGDSIATTSTDPGSASDLIFWAGDNGESLIAVEGEGSTANQYLKVDTTAPLVRQTAALNATEVAPVAIDDGDITVSSKVQFTAADEAPEAAEGDKLIVWAKAPDEDDPNSTTTNLMVTAKTAEGVVTNFVTDVLVDAETWYDLQIVAKAEGSGRTATSTFVVKIAEAGQTPTAVTVDNEEATFYSLLAAGATGSQTIASIGFKGTGAVDNIVFAKNAAAAKIPVAISYTLNGAAEDPAEAIVSINDAEGNPISAENVPNVGDTLTIIVAAQQTDSVTCTGLTFNWVSDDQNEAFIATYTLTAQDGEGQNPSKVFAITVTSGGQGGDDPEIVVPGGSTVEAVIAGATSATGIEIANVTAANQVSIDNDNHEITVGETTVSIPAFYTASFDFAGDSTKIVLTLNEAALTTAGTMVEVSVDTAFGLKVSASNTKLYYGLSSCATVNGTYAAPAKAGFTQGTGSALSLSAAKDGTARFYKLYVTDVLPNE